LPRISFGAAFTSFYRLVGPFRSSTAPEVIKTEIWDTITRRGILGNLLMGVIPMIFYLTINGVAFGLEKVWNLVGGHKLRITQLGIRRHAW
jgi:dimethylaniline monooxygenase (N-oxide forming)